MLIRIEPGISVFDLPPQRLLQPAEPDTPLLAPHIDAFAIAFRTDSDPVDFPLRAFQCERLRLLNRLTLELVLLPDRRLLVFGKNDRRPLARQFLNACAPGA